MAVVDTRALPELTRNPRWQQASSRFLVPLEIDSAGVPVTGRIAGVRRDGVNYCRLHASPHVGVRTRELADGGSADSVKIAIALSGTVQVRQHGRHAELMPGQWAVYETGEEYTVGGFVPFGLLVALMSFDRLGLERAEVAGVAARAMDATPASAALLAAATGRGDAASALRSLAEDVRESPPVTRARNLDAAQLVAEALTVIERRLHDPGLGPGYLAAVLGVSRRHLYDVFGAHVGPVGGYIRAERLARGHRLLTDPRRGGDSVAAIGLECGFADAAHFSRAYRARFGRAPSRDRD